MDYFTIYRSEQSGFTPDSSTRIADKVRGNYTDTGLTNGTTFYYVVTVTDLAGNISTVLSDQKAGMPTAESGLTIQSSVDVIVAPDYPVADRDNTVTAKVKNAGYAAADGTVAFSYSTDNGNSYTLIASKSFTGLAGNAATDVSISWRPSAELTAGTKVIVKAEVFTTGSTTELAGERAKLQTQEYIINKAPTAVMTVKNGTAVLSGADNTAPTGAVLSFSADGSVDFGTGYISEYKWSFGDGKTLAGKNVSYGFTSPGTYTVRLTVTDNLGVKTEASQTIVIYDNRPDLYVEGITWLPSDPKENDVVSIRVTIGNKGKGPSNLGFLVGFYIDNSYMGYVKVPDNTVIPVGGTAEVIYTWVALAGKHIVTAKVNDILDSLKETDKTNTALQRACRPAIPALPISQ
jgi:hypothetical protein